MAFEILPDDEVVQVRMLDGMGDVLGLQAMCEHFAKKAHARDRKGSRLAREVTNMVPQKGSFFLLAHPTMTAPWLCCTAPRSFPARHVAA